MESKHDSEVLGLLHSYENTKKELETALSHWIDRLEQEISEFHAKIDAELKEIGQFTPIFTDDMVMRLDLISQKIPSGSNVKVPNLTPVALERQQKVLGALSIDSFRTVDEVAQSAGLKREQTYNALYSLRVRNPELVETRTRLNVHGRPKEYRRRTSEVVRGEVLE